MSEFHSCLRLDNIPLYVQTMFCLSVHCQWMLGLFPPFGHCEWCCEHGSFWDPAFNSVGYVTQKLTEKLSLNGWAKPPKFCVGLRLRVNQRRSCFQTSASFRATVCNCTERRWCIFFRIWGISVVELQRRFRSCYCWCLWLSCVPTVAHSFFNIMWLYNNVTSYLRRPQARGSGHYSF